MSKQKYLLLAGMNWTAPGAKEGDPEVRHEAGDVVDELPHGSARWLQEQGYAVPVGKRVEALIKANKSAHGSHEELVSAVRDLKGIEPEEVEVIVDGVKQEEPEAEAEVGAGTGTKATDASEQIHKGGDE